jgi:glycosyltransferase involved in cell wall biosynthesis
MLSAAALAAAVLMAKPGGRRNVLRYGVPLLIAYGAALVYAWWHYPTDVVAGWCVGVAWVMALWLVLSSARTSAGAPVGARPLRVLLVTSEWPSPEIPCTSPYTVQQVEFLRAAGLSVDVFAFRGARKPRNYLEAWRRLRPQLDPARYDLVHAQHGQAGLLPWPRRLPLVVTFHGTDILGDRRPDGRLTKGGRFLQWLCRLEALLADRVIIVSDAMREHLPASVTPVLLPSGVDVDSVPAHSQDEARRALGLPLSERLILFVGNPATIEKRYDLAERAVEVLAERLPARLVVGWNRSQREILVLMRACDVLVMTSRQEGSPTVVKEALACALPVVSVRVGDVAKRIAGVDGCELCSDDRPETVAAALERVLRRGRRLSGGLDPELDERVLTERLVALYRLVLTGAGRRW